MPSGKPKTSSRTRRRVHSTDDSSSAEESAEAQRNRAKKASSKKRESSSSLERNQRSSSEERAQNRRKERLMGLKGFVKGTKFTELKEKERKRRQEDEREEEGPSGDNERNEKNKDEKNVPRTIEGEINNIQSAASALTSRLSSQLSEPIANKSAEIENDESQSQDSVKKVDSRPGSALKSDPKPTDSVPRCPNCDEENRAFGGENLHIHFGYWCPVTAFCKYCNKMIEMRHVNEHRKSVCPGLVGKVEICEKCQTPGEPEDIKKHEKIKGFCPGQPPKEGYGRCNLCKKEVENDREEWKKHLMGVDGCKKNPKRLLSGLGHTG